MTTTKSCATSLLAIICLWFSVAPALSQLAEVDILIKNGTVFNGSMEEPSTVDIGIRGEKIVFVGKLPNNATAARVIDASGLWVAPGFIDPHTHCESDLSSDKKKSNIAYLTQGVTTVFAGNDGTSPFPTGTKLDKWGQQGIGTNVGLFVGHGTVRRLVLGSQHTRPTADHLRKMEMLVDSAMRDGAFGLSTGLFYAPGSYATTAEIVTIAKVVAQHHGIYDTHIRDESSYTIGLETAIKEAIDIGKLSGVALHISHIKALGVDVWGKSDVVISQIERARDEGHNVTANQYPYRASRTSLVAALIPRWAEALGSAGMIERISTAAPADSIMSSIAENIRRRGGGKALQLSGAKNDSLEHKTIADVARVWNCSEEDAVVRIIRLDPGVRVISFNMTEFDLENFTRQPWVMTGSDGTPGHPRKYGTFTKRLKDYALDRKVITPTFAIHASSGLTAETLRIRDRGFIRPGYFADILIFDPKQIDTKATFENPDVLAEGMAYVLVNGVAVIDNGTYTGKLAGKPLRHSK